MLNNIPLEIYERCFLLTEYIRENEGCRTSDMLKKFRGVYHETTVDRETSDVSIKRSVQRDLDTTMILTPLNGDIDPSKK